MTEPMLPGVRRRSLTIAAALVVFAGLSATKRAQALAPQEVIARLNDSLLSIMKLGKSASFAQRAAAIRPEIELAFDLERILAASVGPRWASFSSTDRASLLAVFLQYTVASYVGNFDSFSGERFEILPNERRVGDDRVVATRLVPASGDPTRIDYVLSGSGTSWKIVDVLLDGSISRVAVQRSDFRSLLASGGVINLAAALREKAARLEADSAK